MMTLKKIEGAFDSANVEVVDEDELYEYATELVVGHQTASLPSFNDVSK